VIYDLHTHTNASDGRLSPEALADLAVSRGVAVLAITDHDTVAGCERLATSGLPGLTLVPGIELSTSWRGRGVHVVGLRIDPANATLAAGIAAQQRARRARAEKIAYRLERRGAGRLLDAAERHAGDAPIGRPHFARALVETGAARDMKTAFRRYLGAGKPGDVRNGWAALDEVIAWIHAAGGDAVLAHPAKYTLTATKLRELVADFAAASGDAIEVCCGSQAPAVTALVSAVAGEYGLKASAGSDFHGPVSSWSAPGRYSPLPGGIATIWDQWPT
jgi:predicted metal-dependent phosphoesterase TrpH